MSTVHLLLKCSYKRTHCPCYIFLFQLQSVNFNHKDYYNRLLVVLTKRDDTSTWILRYLLNHVLIRCGSVRCILLVEQTEAHVAI